MIVRDCRDALRALDVHVDGELPPADAMEVERHLEDCASCAAHASLARMMKRAVREESQAERAPSSLRDRILASARQAEQQVQLAERRRRAPMWKSMLPWAVAAALVIGIGGSIGNNARGPSHGVPAIQGADVAAKVDLTNNNAGFNNANAAHTFILDDFASYHASPLPPEQVDPTIITSVFSPIVGVPVRPMRLEEGLAGKPTFSGARLMHVHNESAATLFYSVGGKRVTVFVFDPQRIRIHSACCLQPRTVETNGQPRTILMGRAKGYPLAAFERDGVGYAVSADLRDDDILDLASHL